MHITTRLGVEAQIKFVPILLFIVVKYLQGASLSAMTKSL